MKIVRIIGGLGNQMFQYALALALRKSNPDEEIYIDSSCMRGYGLHNGFVLQQIFNLSIPQAPYKKIWKVGVPLPHYKLWQIGSRFLHRRTWLRDNAMAGFNQCVFDTRDYLLDGCWQSHKYLIDAHTDILAEFKFPDFAGWSENKRLADIIADNYTTSVHIRRGDYLKIENTRGICTEDYYLSAIKYIKNKYSSQLFLFFSDDIEWCRKSFLPILGEDNALFVDWNNGKDSYRDMQLMSLCSNNIIANSSFSWWGAWLNNHDDKVVIAPNKWMNNGQCPDICPESWIRI